MAKKSTLSIIKDKITCAATPKPQKPCKTTPKASIEVGYETEEKYQTGIKGKKTVHLPPDSVLGKLETRLKSKGLTMKIEHSHHLNVTITRETPEHTTQITKQTGENLIQSEADYLYNHAVSTLLDGGV